MCHHHRLTDAVRARGMCVHEPSASCSRSSSCFFMMLILYTRLALRPSEGACTCVRPPCTALAARGACACCLLQTLLQRLCPGTAPAPAAVAGYRGYPGGDSSSCGGSWRRHEVLRLTHGQADGVAAVLCPGGRSVRALSRGGGAPCASCVHGQLQRPGIGSGRAARCLCRHSRPLECGLPLLSPPPCVLLPLLLLERRRLWPLRLRLPALPGLLHTLLPGSPLALASRQNESCLECPQKHAQRVCGLGKRSHHTAKNGTASPWPVQKV